MRILMIAPEPFFEPRGTPFSEYHRIRALLELGHTVDLVTYPFGQGVDLPGLRVFRCVRPPFLRHVGIGPSVAKVPLDLALAVTALRRALADRYDAIHSHEEGAAIGIVLSAALGIPHVYDMHSSLPQQLSNFDFTHWRFPIRVFEHLEKAALRSATAVVTICPDLAEQVEGLLEDSSRHFLIENSIFDDVVLASPRPPSPAEAELMEAVPRPLLVVYSGTFETYQGLDMLIQAFAQVHMRRPDASLLLVGGTPAQVAQYRAVADTLGLYGSVRFTGRVTPATARTLSRHATVLTSPRVKGTNTPLKISEQLASGIPLVATRIHSHTQVLGDDVCFLVEPTASAMAEGILEAITDSTRREAVIRKALALYESRYSRHVYKEKMRRLLQLLGKSSTRSLALASDDVWTTSSPGTSEPPARSSHVGSVKVMLVLLAQMATNGL